MLIHKENPGGLLNKRAGWLGAWPGWRAVLDPENARIQRFLKEQSLKLPADSNLLDASAGNRPYKPIFRSQCYESCDMPNGFYRCEHDFECYLDDIPREDAYYDTVILTQVLEHVPNPEAVLRELARVTRPGGKLLLSVPMICPLHGEPWHFFNFTHHGLAELAKRSQWNVLECEKIGGAFWVLGKRLAELPGKLMKNVDPFRAKKRGQSIVACLFWTFLFFPVWLLTTPLLRYLWRPLCYWLDRIDFEKQLTTGYTAVFERRKE